MIRPEQVGDAAAIHRVHCSAFPTEMEARLVDCLREAGRLVISLVALVDEQIVGHIAFSPVTVAGETEGLGLAPVAVAATFQRRGIGATLIRAGLEACRQAEADFVVVLGDPNYYARFGFLPASRWKLSDEFGGGDAFQTLEFRRGAIPPEGGLVRYAEEFSRFAGDESGS